MVVGHSPPSMSAQGTLSAVYCMIGIRKCFSLSPKESVKVYDTCTAWPIMADD